MRKHTGDGMSVLIAGVLLGSGVATMAMLPRIKKIRLLQRTQALSPVPAKATQRANHRPQWDEPVQRDGQPDWDRNPKSG